MTRYTGKNTYEICIKKIKMWYPNNLFNATEEEIKYTKSLGLFLITNNTPTKQDVLNIHIVKWDNKIIHKYFKNIEKQLIIKLCYGINNMGYHNDKIPTKLLIYMNYQWRMLALLRDMHDYICERDSTHHVRTDDCRRFMRCLVKGLETNKFAKPVHRILNNIPQLQFTHPIFIRFNP
jgi:hypothetical protein